MYDETYQSPNFGYPKGSHGRNGQDITGICLHISGAHWQSNYNWIMNPAANASYNAIVRDDGSVVSLVPEENAAYSHGRINRATWPLLKDGVNPNLYTLSLARTGSNQRTWTREQLQGTIKVLKIWSRQYDIPLKRPYIFGHFEIDSVNRWYCPGEAFFNRVMTELAKIDSNDLDVSEPKVWHRVIAGSFRDQANASRRQHTLKDCGIKTFIAPYNDADGQYWHRVVAGSYLNADNARAQANNLIRSGIDAFVVRYREEDKCLT